VEQLIRSSYKTFVGKVAVGRGLEATRVDAIGQGHVYSGTRGRDLGLVDELGGLWTTIALAKQAAHVAAPRGVELRTGPGPRWIDAKALRPSLIGAIWGGLGAAASGSGDTAGVDPEVAAPLGSLLTRAELDFLRTLVRANGKPLVLIDPFEIQDGPNAP